MLGSFAFHLRSVAPEHTPVGQIVLAGVPDDANLPGRSTGRSRSAAPAGAPGCSQRSRPTSRTRSGWPTRPSLLAEEAGLKAKVWDVERLEADGFGGILGIGQGSATPPRLIQLEYTPTKGARKAAAPRPGRQGDHLRHRRPLHQARRGDGQHEARHDRWRRGARRHGRPRRSRLPGQGHRPRGRRRERRRRQRPAPRRRGPPLRRSHDRGDQHRCRGSRRHGGRPRVRRRQARPRRPRRRGHPDRRDEGRARPAGRRVLRQQRRLSPTRSATPERPPGNRCGASRWSPTTRRSCPPRSPTPTTRPAVPARSPRRCSSSTSSGSCPGPTSTSPPSAMPPPTASSGPSVPPASVPARC